MLLRGLVSIACTRFVSCLHNAPLLRILSGRFRQASQTRDIEQRYGYAYAANIFYLLILLFRAPLPGFDLLARTVPPRVLPLRVFLLPAVRSRLPTAWFWLAPCLQRNTRYIQLRLPFPSWDYLLCQAF